MRSAGEAQPTGPCPPRKRDIWADGGDTKCRQGRDWSAAAANPGTPRPLEAGKGRKDPPLEASEGGDPAEPDFNFQPPELRERVSAASDTTLVGLPVTAGTRTQITSHGSPATASAFRGPNLPVPSQLKFRPPLRRVHSWPPAPPSPAPSISRAVSPGAVWRRSCLGPHPSSKLRSSPRAPHSPPQTPAAFRGARLAPGRPGLRELWRHPSLGGRHPKPFWWSGPGPGCPRKAEAPGLVQRGWRIKT